MSEALMRAPWYFSIRFKIIIMMVVPIVCLFLIFIWNTHKILNEFILESTRSTLSNYSQTINLALSIQLASKDAGTLEPFLQELVSAETGGIIYLALLDDHGAVIAKTRQSPDPFPSPDTNMAEAVNREVVHIEHPILLASSNVGTFRYGISIAAVKDAAQHLFIKNLVDGLLTLGLILVILMSAAFVVMLGLNRRLIRLMNTSAAITSGQYDITVEDHGRDELKVLSSQINIMAGAIRSRIHDLEKRENEIKLLNSNLQVRNKEIAKINEELVETLEHLKMTQDNLIQSEKLAGLGSIVAAVAHELNTPIGNAVTVASAFAIKTKAFHDGVQNGLRKAVFDQFLNDSEDASNILLRNLTNAANLISSFKHVAVDQTSSMQRKFILDAVIDDVLTTLRPSIKHRPLEIRKEIKTGIEMNSYPGPLGQVITNLFNNAVLHAFDEGQSGQILIRAQVVDGDRVEISFRDNGKGIPQKNLPKLFDPFFTTKLGKGGSGLGLHIVYNIVTGILQGEIKVTSVAGEGTEFVMLLPAKAKQNNSK